MAAPDSAVEFGERPLVRVRQAAEGRSLTPAWTTLSPLLPPVQCTEIF
jgi:hypothetical protein